MLKNLSINSISNFLKYVFHNKKIFLKKNNLKNQILVEYNALCDSHIVYSYLSNILVEKYNSQICSFETKFSNNSLKKITDIIKKIIPLSYLKIYQSFGAIKHIVPIRSSDKLVKNKTNFIFQKIRKKEDLYNIEIDNIKVGDLIYDGYLRKYNFSTVDIDSEKFKKYLLEFVDLFYFWLNYFNKNRVKALIVSHTVYEFGIVLRIAINNNVKVYSAGSFFIFCHDKKNQTIFDMPYYNFEFNKLDQERQKKGIEDAKKYLVKKFSGEKTIENKVSSLPPDKLFLNQDFKNRILLKSNKKKILIAAHHFSDAPNAYGRFIFNDFNEWIDFLAKKSENTKFEWYIKFHPMEFDQNKNTANFFLQKYKNLNLINKDVSHSQLIAEGINLVLTVYGTIALEYAYFKIPVINASPNNPHCAYNFNYHAKSIDDYNRAIDNFDKLQLNYDKNKLYEYFYMRYLHGFYLFEDEIKNASENLNYQSPSVYGKWLKNFSIKKHEYINKNIKIFLEKNEFRCKKIW